MARVTKARHRLCRRLGEAICGLPRCPARRRAFPPGVHGQRRARTRLSEYGRRLLEKQKLRGIYGLGERQFQRYFTQATRAAGPTGQRLLQLLECRLDNLVYRLGMARSRPMARQLVSHGHIAVDGRRVDRPSYTVQPGQVVAVRPGRGGAAAAAASLAEITGQPPPYLELDREQRTGRLLRLPERDEIPVAVDEALIVEFYSR